MKLTRCSDGLRGCRAPIHSSAEQQTNASSVLDRIVPTGFFRSTSYGILVKECICGSWPTIAIVAPFSANRTAVLDLIDHCARLQLAPGHLLDVVQDFLTQQALTT